MDHFPVAPPSVRFAPASHWLGAGSAFCKIKSEHSVFSLKNTREIDSILKIVLCRGCCDTAVGFCNVFMLMCSCVPLGCLRVHGRPYKGAIVPFGEQVLCGLPKRLGNLESQRAVGLWLGKTEESDEQLILAGGIVSLRGIILCCDPLTHGHQNCLM